MKFKFSKKDNTIVLTSQVDDASSTPDCCVAVLVVVIVLSLTPSILHIGQCVVCSEGNCVNSYIKK